MNRGKLLQRLARGALHNIAFRDMVDLVEHFGFRLARASGSHHIFTHPGIADIPDLEHCSAFGKTPEEALREVEAAKTAWLETAKREEKPLPQPRYRPLIYQITR